jgi:hypothetical protein
LRAQRSNPFFQEGSPENETTFNRAANRSAIRHRTPHPHPKEKTILTFNSLFLRNYHPLFHQFKAKPKKLTNKIKPLPSHRSTNAPRGAFLT